MDLQKEKISVIMSMYNASKTVEESIMSVINQSYNNIELIVVNDCSTDRSKNIVENLMKHYPNIKLINHNINKGCGLARRAGVEYATGLYIGFLDSDDKIHRDFYTTLYNQLKINNADIVISKPYFTDNTNYLYNPKIYNIEVHTGDDILTKRSEDKKWLNASLSKKHLWDNVKYSSLRFIEDTPTMYRLLTKVSKLVYLDYRGYFYYANPNSIVHTSSELKRAIYRVLATMEILDWDKDKRGLNKKVFVIRIKQLGDILKNSSYREIKQYTKELFRISQYFVNNII